jgi:hypothetical protein
MKNLTLVLVLIGLASNSFGSTCEITLKSKKSDSSSAKIGDVTFSKKQLAALASVCTVKRSSFSTDELIQLETLAYNKRIAKLKK